MMGLVLFCPPLAVPNSTAPLETRFNLLDQWLDIQLPLNLRRENSALHPASIGYWSQ